MANFLKDFAVSTIRDGARDYLNNFPLYDYISKLGSFGKVVFRVSENDLLTPSRVDVTLGNRSKKHTRIGAPDITEFETRQLKKVSLPIKLYSKLCNIKATIDELSKICEEGEHYPLILAGDKVGENNFRIDSFSYSYEKTSSSGIPLVVSITLSLEEYIPDIRRVDPQFLIQNEEEEITQEQLLTEVYDTEDEYYKEEVANIRKELEKEPLW